jgi:histone H3/H4
MAATDVINPTVLNTLTQNPEVAPAPVPPQEAPVPVPVPAAAPASPASSEGGRHTDPKNYTTYIYKIAKEVYHEMSMSADTTREINRLLVDFAESVIRSADAMAAADKIQTLNLKEIRASVPGLLPVDLIDQVIGFADNAVRNFDPKLLEGPKRRRASSPKDSVPVPAAALPTPPAVAAPKPAAPKVSRATRAGLIIAVSRVENLIREVKQTERVGAGAPLYLAAVMEFLARDILEVTAKATLVERLVTMKLRFLLSAVTHEPNLRRLYGYWVVEQLQSQA